MSSSENNLLKQKKFIIVTGGVISGIGKGVTASSIGILMKMMKVKPTAIKIDPYLNVDAGTMSPFEHGEVFVLDDGTETDLDLGNYERFLDVRLTNDSNITTGKIYQAVIAKERKGDYLGKTVQIIPHITNEIIDRILAVTTRPVDDEQKEPEVCVIELGGTIGDIESMPFVEALRQLQLRVNRENFCVVHVSMVPAMGEDGEHKTKPTQHSVKELRSLGLTPDFIVCRSKREVLIEHREKISLFCNVPVSHVLSIPDVKNIYHVPLIMFDQKFHMQLSNRLQLQELHSEKTPSSSIIKDNNYIENNIIDNNFKSTWEKLVQQVDNVHDDAIIALVGKYTDLQDAYLSVTNALKHSCIATGQRLKLVMVESTDLEESTKLSNIDLYNTAWSKLKHAQGIVVPGGFGSRGVEGKIEAIKFVRENGIPFLGVCLGMQVAVIEYVRNKLGRKLANSREFIPTISDNDAAVVFMPEGDKEHFGGTMRLGSRKTILQSNSHASKLYGNAISVDERHRHRYEVNPDLVNELVSAGLRFSGKDETGQRMEIVELDEKIHPYFVGVQFHPEFKSRPQRPAPVFLGLLQAVKKNKSPAI
jgi:CTP synthase